VFCFVFNSLIKLTLQFVSRFKFTNFNANKNICQLQAEKRKRERARTRTREIKNQVNIATSSDRR